MRDHEQVEQDAVPVVLPYRRDAERERQEQRGEPGEDVHRRRVREHGDEWGRDDRGDEADRQDAKHAALLRGALVRAPERVRLLRRGCAVVQGIVRHAGVPARAVFKLCFGASPPVRGATERF